jgi:hypothetical protein
MGEVLDFTTGLSAGGRFEDISAWNTDKSTRMLRYMDDGHNPASPASAENRFGEVRAWLEKYVPAR